MSVAPTESVTLTVEWRTYQGGPLVPVTGVTVAINRVSNGDVVLAATSVGVSNPGTGLNAYTWVVPAIPDDTVIVQWSGTDVEGDTVTATELIAVDAPTDVYTDLATLRTMLGANGVDAASDTLISAAITAASRSIDARCGRRFYSDVTASARSYDISGRTTYNGARYSLLTDDISTPTGLLLNGSAWTQYEAVRPGRPITYLLSDLYAASPFFDVVTVTAVWGWPAVPDEIKQATALLASRLYKRKDSPQGVIGSDQWGVTRVARFDPDVEALINPYRLPGFA